MVCRPADYNRVQSPRSQCAGNATAGKSQVSTLPGKTDRLSGPATEEHIWASSWSAAGVENRAADLERRPRMDDIAIETGVALRRPTTPLALSIATRYRGWQPAFQCSGRLF